MSILIQNGTLLCPEGPVKADLRVEDGKIAQLGPALPAPSGAPAARGARSAASPRIRCAQASRLAVFPHTGVCRQIPPRRSPYTFVPLRRRAEGRRAA